jgi:hypothetical protein
LDLKAIVRPLLASLAMVMGVTAVLRITGTAGRPTGLAIGIPTGIATYSLIARALLWEEMRSGVRLVKKAVISRRATR